jgi:peptide/nickel transport system substrate-binding protein
MFKSYTPGESLTLVKNPYWSAATDPGRHQYVNEFDMSFTVDSAKIDQTMLADSGAGQTTLSYDPVLSADYQKFSQDASDRLIVGSEPCTFIWYPDNRQITDIKVRQALAWAYPYQAAWAAGGYIAGVTRIAASNVMPPGIPGRVPYNPLPGHKPGTTDPAKAKSILQADGKLGYTIKYPYDTDVPQSVDVKNVVESALKQAGFNPQPYASTSTNVSTQVTQNPKAPVNIRSSGWCSDWPSGTTWLPTEFQSTNIAKDGFGANYEAFSNKAVDARINAIQLLPLSKQPAAWNALDKEVQTKYFPIVVTGYGGVAMTRGSKVHGDLDDTTLGGPTWKDIWLS